MYSTIYDGKQSFIRFAKDTVLNIYRTNYEPATTDEYLGEDVEDENDEFLNHIFGKQKKTRQNEVELYLKAPKAARNQDILLWWKVYIQ
jgi:hypothetical protein